MIVIIGLAAFGGIVAGSRFNNSQDNGIEQVDISRETIPDSLRDAAPVATAADEITPASSLDITPAPLESALPAEIYIQNVAFIEQTPLRNWDEVHKETCEEAAILTLVHYLRGDKTVSKEQVESELLAIVAWEKEIFGFFEDTNVDQTAEILKTYFKLGDRVRIIDNASLIDLKRELAAGRPVIVPTAGRLLGNRFFKNPGPVYHMNVAIGYDKNDIITHDPGTFRGANYRYPVAGFWNAVHDFVDRTDLGMASGAKRLIVVQ